MNPDAPAEAVLLAGGSAADYIGLVFGIIFTAFPLGMLLMVAMMSGMFDPAR